MSKKWTRVGGMPDVQRVTFVVSAKDDPELAQWVWDLPYRGASVKVREALLAHVRGSVKESPSVAPNRPAQAATKQVEPSKPEIAPALPTHDRQEASASFEADRVVAATLTHEPSAAQGLDTDALNAMRQLGSMG